VTSKTPQRGTTGRVMRKFNTKHPDTKTPSAATQKNRHSRQKKYFC
jgi:hypothetical protein